MTDKQAQLRCRRRYQGHPLYTNSLISCMMQIVSFVHQEIIPRFFGKISFSWDNISVSYEIKKGTHMDVFLIWCG